MNEQLPIPQAQEALTVPQDGPSLSASPIALIREAIAAKADPAYLRELLAVRREWEADEARKAFNVALAEFQARAPIVAKDDQGDKNKYAKIDRIWRTIRPITTSLGLSVTWQICELKGDSLCHLEGKLAHRLGHHERIVFDLPIPPVITTRDGRAVTNVSQQMGSAHTYAQRYATCAALGIITGEDDDGNAAGGGFITAEQAGALTEKIDACRGLSDFNEPTFWKWLGVSTVDAVPANRLADAMAMLDRKLKGKATP